jgi:hypothetical protein
MTPIVVHSLSESFPKNHIFKCSAKAVNPEITAECPLAVRTSPPLFLVFSIKSCSKNSLSLMNLNYFLFLIYIIKAF